MKSENVWISVIGDCLEITWTSLRRSFLASWRRKGQRNSQSYLAGFATISWPKRSSKVVQVVSRQSLSMLKRRLQQTSNKTFGFWASILRTCVIVNLTFLSCVSLALTTEVGVSYNRKKNTFDENNYVDSESTTGSLSFYFLEKLALECSYTKALGVRGEKASLSDPVRLTVQKTEVYGLDLIFMILGSTSQVQPYIKGGVAQIKRRQETKVDNFQPDLIEPATAIVPSYGAGIKIKVTENLSAKLSYDVWQTPIGDNMKTDDSGLHVGLSWIL